jgi:predicted transcriptional regulator
MMRTVGFDVESDKRGRCVLFWYVYNQRLRGGSSVKTQKPTDLASDTVVVSFRAPRELVNQLDKIALGDQRTRANFIVRTLTQAVALEPAVHVIEQIQRMLVEEDEKDPDSIQTEFNRGLMSGARWVIAAFFGKRAIRSVSQKVRKRTGLPMPHAIALNRDGNRYGFDSEPDF